MDPDQVEEQVLALECRHIRFSRRPLTWEAIAALDPNEHDYPLWRKRWAELLEGAARVQVETAWVWPSGEQFERVGTIAANCCLQWNPARFHLQMRRERGIIDESLTLKSMMIGPHVGDWWRRRVVESRKERIRS